MKIIGLQAENIKRLVAIEIKPKGNLVEITGKNGQGKTSVLDSIWWALAGSSTIQAVPIRQGQTDAMIRLDLGEIIVTRKFRDKEGDVTSTITVESKEGAKFSSPQAMLDDLVGQLSFDPLGFSRMTDTQQFDALRKFVPGVDFESIEAQNKADYSQRTDLNRRAKDERTAELKIIGAMEGKPVDEYSLINELESAGKHNSEIEARKIRRQGVQREIDDATLRLSVIKNEAEDLQAEIDLKKSQLSSALPLPVPIEVADIRQHILEAREINQRVSLWHRKIEHRKKADELETSAKALTDAMEERNAAKKEAIAKASLPVPGLGFGEGNILLNGVPFGQASDAEQLKASVSIAMSLNPKLRVIRVRDGSLLDENSMALLESMANEQDFQIWIEVVDGSGKVGFVLEEGVIKKALQRQELKATF